MTIILVLIMLLLLVTITMKQFSISKYIVKMVEVG